MRKKSNNSDLELVERIRDGDSSVFRELVDKYKNESFSLACSIIKNEQDAEDVLQEAFIKAFRNIRKFRGKSAFATWFYRIVVNTCYTYMKKKDKRSPEEIMERDHSSHIIDPVTGYDQLTSSEQKETIQWALKKMKTEEALLLQLYYLSEMSVQEIKQITGFGESKIKVTLHRARISLYDSLEQMLGHELKNIR